jgi:hypothetical protein
MSCGVATADLPALSYALLRTQHTSAYVSIRQYAERSIRQHTTICFELRLEPHAENAASVSIRQHTSAYVRIRQYAERSIRQHPSAYVSIPELGLEPHAPLCLHALSSALSRCVPVPAAPPPLLRILRKRDLLSSACVSIRQHTSAYVSMRQHTSAYVSIPFAEILLKRDSQTSCRLVKYIGTLSLPVRHPRANSPRTIFFPPRFEIHVSYSDHSPLPTSRLQ